MGKKSKKQSSQPTFNRQACQAVSVEIRRPAYINAICGENDKNFETIKKILHPEIDFVVKEQEIKIYHPDPNIVEKAAAVIRALKKSMQDNKEKTTLNADDILDALGVAMPADTDSSAQQSRYPIEIRSVHQGEYYDAMETNQLIIGEGPAGTGKTYAAVAFAYQKLKKKEVNSIILTRPALESSKTLGFQPGDILNKMHPYMRPIYDAFKDMGMTPADLQQKIKDGAIEIAPLGFLRGRTLKDAVIILDEAQNTDTEEMKTFLTRLGENATTIINGDVTQSDLPRGKNGERPMSGLTHIHMVLPPVEGLIKTVTFDEGDVIRSELVKLVVKSYNAWDKAQEKQNTRVLHVVPN